jgi:hypothetical protein
MKKHILIILLLIFSVMINQAQHTDFIQIKDPIIDNTLTLPSDAKFDAPRYIINCNYVVFQENENIRKILNADIASFSFPSIGDRGIRFALDRNGVYFNGIFIETDTTGFRIVGRMTDIIWKTNDKVFLNATEINGDIDVPSFQTLDVFNRPYQTDKNHVYYRGQKIEYSDGSSAVMSVIEDLVYDKNYVYYKGKIAFFEGDTIHSINHILGKTEKFVLRLNKERSHSFQPGIQAGMDTKTIKPLSRYYSMDKNGVYYRTEKTPVSPQNFKAVKVWDQKNRAYLSDGIKVYAKANLPEPDFDAKSFGMLPHSDFCFDKNGVYERQYNSELQKVFNVKFPFVYTEDVSEENTFITDNSRYIIYQNQAYYPWSDKELYKNLTSEQIALAKENKLNLAPNNQPKKDFDYRLYEANNEIYWNDKKTFADAPTFKSIIYEFYKDKRNVYKYDREKGLTPVRGIDVQTATVNKHHFLADKNYIFANDFRIIKNSNVELLAIFAGYGAWCGMDRTPSSSYYLFKNNEGYWLVLISDEVRVRNLGNKLSENIQKILSDK